MRAIEVLTSELRLALVSRSEGNLGVSAAALMALLHPFEWPHTYIPLLPVAWREYVEAPCPFVIGLTRRPRDKDDEDDPTTAAPAGATATTFDGGDESDEIRALLPSDVCVLDLDAATLTVPADEPLEPFPSTDRTLLLSDLDDWLNGVEENRAFVDAQQETEAEAWSHSSNLGAQRVFSRHWKRILSGYSAHLVDGGTDVDSNRLLESIDTERRPFVTQLIATSAFGRYLERVSLGETVDELSAPAASEVAANANDSMRSEANDSTRSEPAESASAKPQLAPLQLPDDLMLDTLSPPSQASSSGEDDDGNLEARLTWPAEDDEPTAAAVSTVILAAVAAAADASPSSIPFQLTYASELLRANRPMEALGALEAAQQRSREARLQLRRGSSSGDYSPMLSPGGGHHRRSSSRGEHRRSSSRNPPNLSVQSSSSKDSIAFGVELTLRSLVRSCLSRLDPRRLAELATMRGSSFGQSPSTRSRRESATAPPTVPAGSITPLPASIQQPRAAAPSAATTLTDVTEFTEATSGRPTATDISEALDEPATDMAPPATDQPQASSSTWTARIGQTLRDAAAAAAAHRAGMLPPMPPPLNASNSSRNSDVQSPGSRAPLLAVWARAYLDEQSRDEQPNYLLDDSERAGSTVAGATAAGDDDGDDEEDVSSRRTEGGVPAVEPPRLLERLDGASENGPPSGWGLAIPWPWGRDGTDAMGRRQHVAVEPVQLFSQLLAGRGNSNNGGRDTGADDGGDGSGEEEDAIGDDDDASPEPMRQSEANNSGNVGGIDWMDFETIWRRSSYGCS